MSTMNTLELKPAARRGGRGGKFLDFVIDGQSLYELVGRQFDTVSCLAVWPNVDEVKHDVARLVLREEADFPNNRRSLYVCGECGGLDCGAVSLIIEEKEEPQTIVWRDFGYQNNYDDALYEVSGVTWFEFNKEQYVKAIEESLRTLQKMDEDDATS